MGSTRERDPPCNQNVAEIGELEAPFRVLFGYYYGLAVSMLKTVEHLENHINSLGIEANRWFVHEKRLGF